MALRQWWLSFHWGELWAWYVCVGRGGRVGYRQLPLALNIPACFCWVCPECKAPTALPQGHFSRLCLQLAALGEVTSPPERKQACLQLTAPTEGSPRQQRHWLYTCWALPSPEDLSLLQVCLWYWNDGKPVSKPGPGAIFINISVKTHTRHERQNVWKSCSGAELSFIVYNY